MKAHDVIHVADIAHQVVLYLLVCEDGLLVPHLIYKLREEQIFMVWVVFNNFLLTELKVR